MMSIWMERSHPVLAREETQSRSVRMWVRVGEVVCSAIAEVLCEEFDKMIPNVATRVGFTLSCCFRACREPVPPSFIKLHGKSSRCHEIVLTIRPLPGKVVAE